MVSLQCVFHSIRFKVNKVGVQWYPIFLCHIGYFNELYLAYFKDLIATILEVFSIIWCEALFLFSFLFFQRSPYI
ncbi:hypothetical protein HMPREF9999_00863 [Alloprevotella sp. oral taxon 473 str. F0040]|nr:hypothetical protein HMPREF9999_00863 [Alloprevotella sp. oral taxon 473 str. F0040]